MMSATPFDLASALRGARVVYRDTHITAPVIRATWEPDAEGKYAVLVEASKTAPRSHWLLATPECLFMEDTMKKVWYAVYEASYGMDVSPSYDSIESLLECFGADKIISIHTLLENAEDGDL